MIKIFLEKLNPISFEIQVPFLVVLFTIILFVCLLKQGLCIDLADLKLTM